MLLDLSPLKKHPDFRRLYAGQLVSQFGSMMTYVALPYQLYELTKSSFLVGMLGSVQLVPLLIFALWGGAYADAIDRRKLLIVSEAILAIAALSLLANSLLLQPSVAWIFAMGALMSAVNGFHRPALDSLTPLLVEKNDLASVGALNALRFGFSAVAGPALAGAVIAKFGLAATFAVDALTFTISIFAIAGIRAFPVVHQKAAASLASILEGIRYARGRPELIGTYVVDLVAMTFAMPTALFPSMAEAWGGAQAVGWLYAAIPAGTLIITLFSGWVKHVRRQGAMVIVSATLWGVAIIALAFAPSLPWAILCLALAGAADMVSALFRGAIWNETIPSSLRGRLAGLEMISYMSGPLLGNARAGWVAGFSSNSISILSGGILCVVGVLLCVPMLPDFWRYRRGPAPSP